MIRIADIQDKLLHLVGWQQGDTTETKISSYLTESTSGMYFQQVHPLLTIANLMSVAPDYDNISSVDINAKTYKKGFLYNTGDIVEYGGTYYIALQDNAVALGLYNQLDAWSEMSPFSMWLLSKTRASIVKVINRFCVEKLVSETSKTLCENKTLFDNTGRITNVVPNKKNLVGFEIVPVRSRGVTTKINRVGLHFTQPGEYTLYIMHSGSDKPVRTITVTKTTRSFEWFRFDNLYLPYQSDYTDAGGSWFICYRQSELPENSCAIKKDKDWSKGPCRSCSRNEYMSWLAWSKFLEIHPFYINEEIAEDVDGSMFMWDVANNVYTYDNNYGINLDVSVMCDITDFIIDHKELFQDVIAKQVAVDMLRELAYNPNARTNRHILNATRGDILYELDGDSSSLKKSGLSYQLDKALEAIELSVTGLDRICLPCKSNGIKYRTI